MSRSRLGLFLVTNLTEKKVILDHTYTAAAAALTAIKAIPSGIMPGQLEMACIDRQEAPKDRTMYGTLETWTVTWEGVTYLVQVTEVWGVCLDITTLVNEKAMGFL